ncbi:hypothetical protein POTOM_039517 [Populus tomentosa]|uniref:Uncharacterized protein n=1 Tax=Populus tomentosa TaxID=118781 RepID=A0A8X8CBM4_POPTO|nr:hypothetical protein POTOM_039517 [Populus tomentosa]
MLCLNSGTKPKMGLALYLLPFVHSAPGFFCSLSLVLPHSQCRPLSFVILCSAASGSGDWLLKTVKTMKRWPEIVILLITPPPIDEDARLRHRYIEKPLGLNERTNEAAGAYSQACISVAKEYICPLVDLWIKMQECPDWKQAYLIVIVLTKR